LQDGKVNFVAERNHGFGLVEVLSRKEFGRKGSKGVLGGDQDLARVLSAASYVEQAEQHAGRTHAQKFVEVARHALAVVHSRDFRTAQRRHVGMPRVGRRQFRCSALEQGADKIRRRRSQRAQDFRSSSHRFTHCSIFTQASEREPGVRIPLGMRCLPRKS
jgi:hypothetical protein